MLLLGGAMTAAPALRAQQKAMPVIGYIDGAPPGPAAPSVAAFLQGLGETGYVDGQTVVIEYRWGEDHHERVPGMVADLVGRKVDLIVAFGDTALEAKNATSTIPIVFGVAVDPVVAGLVASFARPGGNLTGFSSFIEMNAKRLELLSDLVPRVGVFALLVNPSSPTADLVTREVQEAAHVKEVRVDVLKASTETEIDAAFAALVELHAGALITTPDALFFRRREQLVALAARHAVPVIYTSRIPVAAGGLISYGASLPARARQMGIYTGRILKGEKPADLPVQRPTIFELAVNPKTAKALGLTVPPSILARATEVIE
jgi:putative ABC transport system substrate-binding protein